MAFFEFLHILFIAKKFKYLKKKIQLSIFLGYFIFQKYENKSSTTSSISLPLSLSL